MFSLIGAMLVVYGLVTGSGAEMYQHSLGINVNLRWGLVLLVFGAWMLTLAIRASRQARQTEAERKPGDVTGRRG